MERVTGPDEPADFATVEPVTPDEARRCAGTEHLTREHVPLIEDLAQQRRFGRCAVLHHADGRPPEDIPDVAGALQRRPGHRGRSHGPIDLGSSGERCR